MSRAEEGQLTARLRRQPSKVDRDRLITSNLRFVVKVASHYRDCGLPLEDLINEGSMGLMEAVSRYDPARGTRFLTYAKWHIQKSILSALSKQTLVRIPAHRQRDVRRARKEQEALRMEEGSNGENRSAEMQRAVDKRSALLGTRPIELSLEDVWGRKDDERPVDDFMPSLTGIDPVKKLIRDQTRDTVQHAMACLSGVERTIIRGRFGMDDQTPRTLEDIGTDLGLSRERVRQLEIQSKDKMRRAVTSRSRRRIRTRKAQAS